MEKQIRRPKPRHYPKDCHVRLRDNVYNDMVIIGSRFSMDMSEIVREAVSQYIGRIRNDYPDMFKHKEGE